MQHKDKSHPARKRKFEELQCLLATLAHEHGLLEQTEKQLRTSNARYSEAQAIADIGNWELDLATDKVWWSDQIFRIFEIDPNDFDASYEAFLDRVHPEDRDAVDKAYKDSLRNKSPYDITHRLIMKDGRIKYIHERCVTLYADDGTPERSIGTVQDVSEQKELHDALEHSERRFRSIFNESPTGMVIANPDMTLQLTNSAFQKMLGYSARELQAMSIIDITHPDDRDKVRELIDAICSGTGDQIRRIEKKCLHKRGDVVWTLTSFVLVPDHGENERLCFTIVEDITELKKTEASLRSAHANLERKVEARTAELSREVALHKHTAAALRESETQFRTLVENIPGTVFRCVLNNANWSKFYISEAVEDLSGYPASEFINRARTFDSIIHPDDRQRVADIIQEAIGGSGCYVTEYRVVSSTGEVRWVYEKGQVYTDDGIPLWIDGAIFDTTVQKQAEAERLTVADEQRNALIREVHHRIKNNLQGVIGLLGNQAILHPEVAGYMADATAQLESVALVFGLQSHDSRGSVRLCDMIRAIVDSSRSYTQAPINLVALPAGHASAYVIPGEAVALALVINELLLNAGKHRSPDAAGKGVTVSETHYDDTVGLVITNEGQLPPGLDYRLGQGLGTGLGLVKSMLPRDGVSLDISEEEGRVTARLKLHAPLIEIMSDGQGH